MRVPQVPNVLLFAMLLVLVFCCMVVSVTSSGVAVLRCGSATLLTSRNATNMMFLVMNCWQSEVTEVQVSGGVDGAAINSMTLLVSDSVHVRVVVDGVWLVNSTVSLVNVSYPGDCIACTGGGSAIRARNASIEESTVAVTGAVMHDANTTLLKIEASNVTLSSLVLLSSDVGTAAVVETSAITDTNVTLRSVTARTQLSSSVVVALRTATFVRSHVAAVNCTFEVSATDTLHRSPVLPMVSVDNCSLQHSEVLLRNVSARVLSVNASFTSRHRLLSVNRSTVISSSVTLTQVDNVNVGLFGTTSGSVWGVGSSVMLDAFRVQSHVAMPCIAAFEASALHGAVASLSAGAVSGANQTADVLCVADCRVDMTVFSVWHLAIYEQTTTGVAAPASSDQARGVFSVVNSALRLSQVYLNDVLVNVTSTSALVFSSMQSISTRITVTSSILSSARGVRVQHSELTAAQLLFTELVVSTDLAAMEVVNCTAVNISATLAACTLTSHTSAAFLLHSSNVTDSSIAVQRTWLTAASEVLRVSQTTLTTAIVTLVDSRATAAVSAAWVLDSSNVNGSSIVVQRTRLHAVTITLRVSHTTLTAAYVSLVDSNMSAATSAAWVLDSSSVTGSSIVMQRTRLTAASNTFRVSLAVLNTTNVTLVDSNVTAVVSAAWILNFTNVTGSSIVLQRTWLSAVDNTFVVSQTTLTLANMSLVDSNLTAVSGAWFLDSSSVTGSSIVVQRTRLTAASNTFRVSQSALNATNVTLVDSSVTAAVSAAWLLDLSNVTASGIVVQRTWLSAASNTFVVLETELSAANVLLVDSNVTAAASVAWYLDASNVTAGSITVQRSHLYAAREAFRVSQTTLTASNVSLVDSNVTAVSPAWILLTSYVTGGKITLQRTSLTATSEAFRISQVTLTAASVLLVDSNLIAAGSVGWVLDSSNVTGSSITVQRTQVSAASLAFRVSQTTLTAASVTATDSNVTAAVSAAWVLVSSSVTASSIVVQRTRLSAASLTIVVQQTALTATSMKLVDSHATAAVSSAWVFTFSNVTGSSIVVHRTRLHAVSNTFRVSQSALAAANVTLVDSTVTAAVSVVWLIDSSNVTASGIVVQRTWLSASSNTFVVLKTELSAMNVLIVDSNVTAAASAAWFLDTSNVTAGSITVQRTRLTAASNTFQWQQTSLTAANLSLVDSNVTAATSLAWILVSSNVTASRIVVQRTWLRAASFTLQISETLLTAANVLLVDSNVTAVASWGWLLDLSKVTSSSIALLRTCVTASSFLFGLRNTVVNESHFEIRWCSCFCASASADGLGEPAALRVASSTIASSSFLLQGGTLSCGGRGFSVLRVVSSSVIVWSLRVVDVLLVRGKDPIRRLSDDEDANSGAMVAFENSVATSAAVVCRSSTVEGILSFILCNDSRVELETLVVAESNISSLSGDSTSVSFVGAVGDSFAYLYNATVERSRFAGFTTLFGAFGTSTIVIATSAYRCSWWSSSATILMWRPLTKLHLGTSTFERLPVFAGFSDGDTSVVCGVVTASVSLSGTVTALELSGSRSALPSLSATPAVTASGGTATWSSSGTATTDVTATRIVAQRVVKVVVSASGTATLIGVAIAATSFATVRAGLTAQRIAFVLRSGGRQCGALNNDENTAVVVEDVDWLLSPTRLSVGSGPVAVHRGAVIGNVAVCISGALLAAAAVGCAVRGWGLCATAAVSQMHVRHVLCVPVLLLLEPTLASSATLLRDAAGAAADVAIGTAGVVCLACVICGAGRVLDPRGMSFRARAVAIPRGALALPSPTSLLQMTCGVWRWWTAVSVAWQPKVGHSRFVLDWGFLYDDTRGERHWWALVDIGVSVAMGGLSSIVPATSSSCAAWKWAVVAAACGGVVLTVVLVPLASLRAMCECLAMALLTALIAVLGAVDASDAVVEGIGILAAVLQWAPILLGAIAYMYGFQVGHIEDEKPDMVAQVGPSAARSNRVDTSRVRDACRDAGGGSGHISRPHPAHPSGLFSRSQVSEGMSTPRAQSRMTRQATSLRALVSLICSVHQHAEGVTMVQTTR